MSRRPSVYVKLQRYAPSPASPNGTFPGITVDLRVFWPPGQKDAAIAVLEEAYAQAIAELKMQDR